MSPTDGPPSFSSRPWRAGFFCGSVQSLCAVALPGSGWLLSLSSSGDLFGGGARRPAAKSVVTEALEDFFVISLFTRVLCVVWLELLSSPYPLRMILYVSEYMYVFLKS